MVSLCLLIFWHNFFPPRVEHSILPYVVRRQTAANVCLRILLCGALACVKWVVYFFSRLSLCVEWPTEELRNSFSVAILTCITVIFFSGGSGWHLAFLMPCLTERDKTVYMTDILFPEMPSSSISSLESKIFFTYFPEPVNELLAHLALKVLNNEAKILLRRGNGRALPDTHSILQWPFSC